MGILQQLHIRQVGKTSKLAAKLTGISRSTCLLAATAGISSASSGPERNRPVSRRRLARILASPQQA